MAEVPHGAVDDAVGDLVQEGGLVLVLVGSGEFGSLLDVVVGVVVVEVVRVVDESAVGLGGVDGKAEVLLGGPGQAVDAAEPVSGDAEVVDVAGGAHGAAGVGLLARGEAYGHDVSGVVVARWS